MYKTIKQLFKKGVVVNSKELEEFRQNIFDKQNRVIDLEKRANKLREECKTFVQKLKRECPHEEVAHTGGWIGQVVKYAEVDMNCDSSYLEVEVHNPERRCVFCGYYETGRHVLKDDILKEKYKYLGMDETVNIDIEYIFQKLGNQEKRKILEANKDVIMSALICPKEYF